MIIKDLRTHLLSIPYVDPPKVGFLKLDTIDLLVVEIETETGVIGTGYLHPLTGGLKTLEMCVKEMLAPILMGQSIFNVEELWRQMWISTFIQGRMGITVMAMSAIDIALWDAVGRSKGIALWKLWGGKPDPIPVYGSGCYRGLGQQGMIDKAHSFVDQGFLAIKMQVGHTFTEEEDLLNVRAMRSSLGTDIEIMIDVNQGWSVEKAISFGKKITDLDIAWLEEPVFADDFDGYHKVADAISTPVVGGENNFTHHDFKPFFISGKIPILQPDIMRGGYTELKIIASHAQNSGIKIAPHLFPELNTHLLASIPNASWLEYMGWHDHLWIEPLLPVHGFMSPPKKPGHGMDLKPEIFSDCQYKL